MDQICMVIPILPGKTNAAREFWRELETKRKAEYNRSERRIGITKEVWYLTQLSGGDHFVAYIESPDFSNTLRLFSKSQDDFDMWFKRFLAEATGVDLNNPAEMRLPELLSSFQA